MLIRATEIRRSGEVANGVETRRQVFGLGRMGLPPTGASLGRRGHRGGDMGQRSQRQERYGAPRRVLLIRRQIISLTKESGHAERK